MIRALAILTLLLAGAPARAQVPFVAQFDRPRWGFGLALGPELPGGAAGFGRTTNRGFAAGVSAQRFITRNWSFGLELHQSAFAGSDSPPLIPADGSFRIVGARFQAFHLTTRINLISNDHFTPYIGAGLGVAAGKSNILYGTAGGNALEEVSTRGASVSTRAGFEAFIVDGFSWFVEGRYVQYRLDAQSGGPGVAAVAIGAVHAAVGLRFWLDIEEKRK